jgi:hypothetical protein
MPTTLSCAPGWSGLTDPADMFASQDPADKPLREVRETIATMRVANLWAAEKGILADATRNRRQHKRRVLKINQASWNVAHVAAYEFFGCVARARGPAAGGLRTPALPAGAR